MISKKTIKFIKSLQIKKYRKQEQSFLVEGAKNVQELIMSDYEITLVLGTQSFLDNHQKLLDEANIEFVMVKDQELANIGSFKTNNAALAVARMHGNKKLEIKKNEFSLVLDGVRDPGNLGTIIRIADWYDIKNIICSSDSADVYNPKVIAATMGSFVRTNLYYTDLVAFINDYKDMSVYGAFLNGRNIHQEKFDAGGFIVVGNESKGINPQLEKCINMKLTIPRFGGAESLNVANATAIICDNIRRNH
ncbi:RNA methyltransferase [Fulvivirgaceae bacterium BMA10]|uniref:RNA methyltransferase n=1 Tax=Splendidivirga corallicola TaxID=3051826 RepID=A0ABT8KHK5_9BACT|nr:RNA methyltransferase [Fulvivirgaceae bacterium BMA10]